MKRTILTGVGIAAAFVVGIAAGGSTATAEPAPTVTVTADPEPAPTVTVTEAPPEPEPRPDAVKPKDVKVELDVMDKQCFGSAGCNVTVEPAITPKTDAAKAGGYRLTFEVKGDESGPIMQTIDVHTDGTYTYDQVRMSTESSDVTPSAKATAVRGSGL